MIASERISWSPSNLFRKEPVYLAVLLFFILELFFPLIIRDYWILRIIMFANIFVIYATAYDLLGGYTGLTSLGHSLFFGGSGYVAGLISLNLGLPLIICILMGCASAMIFGLLLGYICLRLKGPYFAIATMICPLVFMTIVHLSPTYLGGDNGIAGFDQIAGGSTRSQFYIVLILSTACLFIILRLARGNFGLVLKTIREDDVAAESIGINTTKFKVLAFVISGVFAGLAGTLYVHIMGSVAPTTLSIPYAILPIIMIYLGGTSSIIGPAMGAYVITILDLYLLAFPYVRTVIYAAIIITILRFFPGGLMAVPKEIGRLKGWLFSKS
jgi:branched-chain amino acid transport system permease protein